MNVLRVTYACAHVEKRMPAAASLTLTLSPPSLPLTPRLVAYTYPNGRVPTCTRACQHAAPPTAAHPKGPGRVADGETDGAQRNQCARNGRSSFGIVDLFLLYIKGREREAQRFTKIKVSDVM